ncbi:MAG TPA: hypothetical protein VJ965_12065 [Anaerolineales bacterium]|nr:hypothetical protein [Anaerolineales bacterium]
MMKTQKNYSLIATIALVLTLSALACGQVAVGVATPKPEDSNVADSVAATLTHMPPAETPEPTAAIPTWMDTAELAPYTVSPDLAGLVYRQNENIWVVDDRGYPVLAAANIYAGQLSPDLTQLVYVDGIYEVEDLVLRNLNNSTEQRLTDTPNILEGAVQWWSARPGVLVFNQTPQDELGPWAGYLGAIDLAASERMDLDMLSSSYSGFALSPDGRTILYDDAGSPVLYRWDEGIIRLYMPDYGLNYTHYAAPAWSPDSTLCAFYATRQAADGAVTEAAIVLVNLETGQARELHSHQSFGQRVGPEITFSPDGKWLAVVNPGEAETVQNGPISLWALAVDGSTETYLGYGTGPMWSPTGDRLLFTLWPPVGAGGGSFQEDAHITITEVGQWSLQEVSPMVGSTLFDWVALP